jgi:hypothetical protein
MYVSKNLMMIELVLSPVCSPVCSKQLSNNSYSKISNLIKWAEEEE